MNSAVRTRPTCGEPVGDGQNRTRTGTVTGLEDIDPRNSYHFQTLNGDISYLNAIAYVILEKYPAAVMPEEWLERHTAGWREYIEGIKARYSPQQVVDRLHYIAA